MQSCSRFKSLSTTPVLHIYCRAAHTELNTDACKDGFGAVLLQIFDGQLHPVYFWSRKTSTSDAVRHSYIVEAKAIYLALRKFLHYLMGIYFKLVTDCSAFKDTTRKDDIPRELAAYVMYLQDFTCDVVHKPGENMKHVDHSSRHPQSVWIVAAEVAARIKMAQKYGDYIKAIAVILQDSPYQNFIMKRDILYRTVEGIDLRVVPKSVKKEVIRESHALQKTVHCVKQQFWNSHLEQ